MYLLGGGGTKVNIIIEYYIFILINTKKNRNLKITFQTVRLTQQ